MPSRIDIAAPATITVVSDGQSSLDFAPPGGILVTDPTNGTIAVTISAGNSGAAFSASSASGATVSSNGGMITIIGLQAQVNAALASLTITDPATDTVTISATDTAALTSGTDIAVNAAAGGLGFAAPPASVTLSPYSLTTIGGLVLGDPQAAALAAAGLGGTETLAITLAVASGILLLPGLSSLSGVQAAGNGTSQILLTFTANDLAAVNALLAGLEYAAPAAVSGLAYAMRNVSGPLGGASTSGNIVLEIAGTQGAAGTVSAGADTVILGPATLAGLLTVSGVTTDIGGLQATAGAKIWPEAALQMPYNTLSLGGTSLDFGTLGAAALNETGTLLIAGAAVIGGLLSLGGAIDFAGTLITAENAQTVNQTGLSLGAGALVAGDGTLVAGNFSEAGLISGPGTLLAGPGDTLVLDAAGISGTTLDVAAGGVLVLGPVDPLYGIFNPTPLTVASNVTLNFLDNSGPALATGDYADTLAQTGGVIVIESPDVFAGTIDGFAPGDRIVFPEISGLTLLSITSHSFVIAGNSINGTSTQTVSYLINAAYPSGDAPFVMMDLAGDSEVSLRDTAADVFINGAAAYADVIFADPGIAQPILGAEILLRTWTTQALTVTLSVGHGVLADGFLPPAARLTITAASPAALNATLASLAYTGNTGATADTLTIASSTGLLAGLLEYTPISLSTAGGTVSGFGDAGQTSWFAGEEPAPPLSQAAAPGAILVTGTADFANLLLVNGVSGTALQVDAGGAAIFDAAADVVLGGNAIIGDAGGPGQLDVLTSQFFVGSNLTIGGAAAGSGAIIAGAATIAGTLAVGASAAAGAEISGVLGAAIISIGAAGTLTANGGNVGFEQVTDAGTINLFGASVFTGSNLNETGALTLGGTTRLVIQGATQQAGTLDVGADAVFDDIGAFTQSAGFLLLSGTLVSQQPFTQSGVLVLSGGTLVAPVVTLAGTLAGGGVVEGAGGLGVLDASGGIIATGALTLGDDVTLSGTAGITITTLAALDIVHALTGGTIDFAGGGAELTINDLAAVTTAVGNMLDHDAIDLVGIAPSLVSFANGSIFAPTGGFSLSVAGGQPALQIGSDGYGGTLLTLGGDMPCFCSGTRLLTPTGFRPVESFSPGDPVITIGGMARAVRWIGRRTLDFFAEPRAQPVFFAAGALGPGMPARPVRLSPLHAVFFDGVLVPALHLVNGATITQDFSPAATYYHLELDRHDILIADGMGAESYLDNGNRGALYFEQGRRGTAGTACAPLVTTGAKLAAIRRRLHEIALAAGFTPTYSVSLRGAAAQTAILPRVSRKSGLRIARFALPPNAESLRLAARAATPADTDPESEDRRRLGICVRDAGGAALGQGWLPRAPADAGVWMAAAAELLLPPGLAALTLELAAVVQSWRAPIDFGGARQ